MLVEKDARVKDRDSDVHLGESLQELVERLGSLRDRIAPFLVPASPMERGMDDGKVPERSALEDRLVWITGQIADAEEIISDINTRLYIPATIDPAQAKGMDASA